MKKKMQVNSSPAHEIIQYGIGFFYAYIRCFVLCLVCLTRYSSLSGMAVIMHGLFYMIIKMQLSKPSSEVSKGYFLLYQRILEKKLKLFFPLLKRCRWW